MDLALRRFYALWANNFEKAGGSPVLSSAITNSGLHLATAQISDDWIQQETESLANTMSFLRQFMVEDSGDHFTAYVPGDKFSLEAGYWGRVDNLRYRRIPTSLPEGFEQFHGYVSGNNLVFRNIPKLPIDDLGELSRIVREGFRLLPAVRNRHIDQVEAGAHVYGDHEHLARRHIREERETAKEFTERARELRRYQENRRSLLGMRAGASGGRGAGAVGGGGGASGTDTTLYLNRPSLLGF